MIVKVNKYEDLGSVSPEYQRIFGNVTKIYKYMDTGDQYLDIYIEGKEEPEFVAITRTDKDGNHPSLVSSIWLMNDKGETIERII